MSTDEKKTTIDTNESSQSNPAEELKMAYNKIMKNVIPYDPRFPNTNQTRNCQQNYIDYFRCLKKKDGDEEYCAWYKHAYTQLCPPEWVDKWNEQRENGNFPIRDIS